MGCTGNLMGVGTTRTWRGHGGSCGPVMKPSPSRMAFLGAVVLVLALLVLPRDAQADSLGGAATGLGAAPGAATAMTGGATAVVTTAQAALASVGHAAVAQIATGAATGAGGVVPVTPAQVVAAATPTAVHASSADIAAPAARAVGTGAGTAAPTDHVVPTPTVAPTDNVVPTPTVAPTDNVAPADTAAADTRPSGPAAVAPDRSSISGGGADPSAAAPVAPAPTGTGLASSTAPRPAGDPQPAGNGLPDLPADGESIADGGSIASEHGLGDLLAGLLSPTALPFAWPTPLARLPSLPGEVTGRLGGVLVALAPILHAADPGGPGATAGPFAPAPLLQSHRPWPGWLPGLLSGPTVGRQDARAARRPPGRVIPRPVVLAAASSRPAAPVPLLSASVGIASAGIDSARGVPARSPVAASGRAGGAGANARPPVRPTRRRPAPAAAVQPASGVPVITTGATAAAASAGGGVGATAVLLVGALALCMLALVGGRLSLELSAWRSTLLTLRLERPG